MAVSIDRGDPEAVAVQGARLHCQDKSAVEAGEEIAPANLVVAVP